MRFASGAVLALALATGAYAGAINTDSALVAGKGQVVTRTKARYAAVQSEIDRYLVQQTVLYGASNRLSLFGTLGYAWNRPGADGLTDLLLRGRYRFFARDEKRGTLSLAVLAGLEVPIGEQPIGSPDGGLRAGLVGTWERSGWRVDADVERSWRPNAPDFLKADIALIKSDLVVTKKGIWMAVAELNYRRPGRADVLFVAPGVVYEIPGWKFEASWQIAVATDAPGPAPRWVAVLSLVKVF